MAGEFPALGGRGLREIELLIVTAQEPKQRLELLGLTRVRGCREQDEVLFRLRREATQEVVALLLARRRTGRTSTGVGFIDNHQLGSLLDEQIAATIRLHIINTNNLVGVVVVDTRIALDLAVEARLRTRANDHRLDIELLADLALPLVAEVWQADHGKASDPAALQEFAHQQERLDRLTDTNIISDEEAHDLLAQRHDQRHQLVRARAEGEPGQRTEGPGAIAEGEAGGLEKELRRRDITEICGRWWGEVCVPWRIVRNVEGQVNPRRLVIGATERLHQEQVRVVGGQHDPIATTERHQFARLEQCVHQRTFLKISGRLANSSARFWS